MYLSTNRKKGKVVLTKCHLEHNHPCTRESYDGYPEVRKMSEAAAKEAGKLQKLKVIPTLIRPALKDLEKSDKIILGRDISNVK